MPDIESNAVHVKLSSVEAIEAKREILESELGVLKLFENFKKFKEYRKKEGIEKGKSVKIMHEIARDIENLVKNMPKKEGEEKTKEKKKISKKSIGKKVKEDEISLKLREIRERLAKLHS